jgi:hypothetical protein
VNIAEEIPNWNSAVVEIQGILQNNPALIEKAKSYGDIYKGRRGLMVVDVICSRQRNYEKKVIANLLPSYESKAKDLSLKSLALKAPTWMKIMKVEPLTMQLVAQKLLDFGDKNNLVDEDTICRNWAVNDLHWLMLEVNGIGPVLLEYLRMFCGFDIPTLDVNVGKALSTLGIQTKGYSADIVFDFLIASKYGRKGRQLELVFRELKAQIYWPTMDQKARDSNPYGRARYIS